VYALLRCGSSAPLRSCHSHLEAVDLGAVENFGGGFVSRPNPERAHRTFLFTPPTSRIGPTGLLVRRKGRSECLAVQARRAPPFRVLELGSARGDRELLQMIRPKDWSPDACEYLATDKTERLVRSEPSVCSTGASSGRSSAWATSEPCPVRNCVRSSVSVVMG
jgi:hypothetical protein